jgi:hypothetical protein
LSSNPSIHTPSIKRKKKKKETACLCFQEKYLHIGRMVTAVVNRDLKKNKVSIWGTIKKDTGYFVLFCNLSAKFDSFKIKK